MKYKQNFDEQKKEIHQKKQNFQKNSSQRCS
jgi:hypothetical protein